MERGRRSVRGTVETFQTGEEGEGEDKKEGKKKEEEIKGARGLMKEE